MRVESAGDRAAFFNEDEFGEPALYTPPADDAVAIPCTIIFNRGRAADRFSGDGYAAAGAERSAWLNADELELVEEYGTIVLADADFVPLPGGETLQVAGPPKLEETGCMWTVELVIV